MDVLDEFIKWFSCYGFWYEVYYFCYGMVEMILIVIGGDCCKECVLMSVDGEKFDYYLVVLGVDGEELICRIVGCGNILLEEWVVIVDL